MVEIAASSSISNSIRSLQETERQSTRISNEIATGRDQGPRKVNATLFAKVINDRAEDLASAKSQVFDGIQSIETARLGLQSAEDVLEQAKAVAATAEATTDPAERARLEAQFNELASQASGIVEDASYLGVNLVGPQPDDLNVTLNETGSSQLSVPGQAADSASLNVEFSVASVDAAIGQLRNIGQDLGTRSATLEIRSDFTQELTNTLETAAAERVQSDLNEDAAEALSNETRRQLSTESLSIAVQSQRSVLQLF